jgi:hypothetical protein
MTKTKITLFDNYFYVFLLTGNRFSQDGRSPMRSWCLDNLGPQHDYGVDGVWYEVMGGFCFSKEADAAWFSLRWL